MTLATILLVLSSIAGLVAWIWLVVIAFQRGEKGWGTAMIVGIFVPLLGPILTLIYLITRWTHTRQAGMLYLSSLGAAILGMIVLATSLKSAMESSPEFQELMELKAQTEAAAAARGDRSLDAAGWTPPPEQTPPTPDPTPKPAPPPPRPKPPTPPTPPTEGNRPTAPTPSPRELQIAPIRLKVLELGTAGPNQMRSLRVRLMNDDDRPVKEVKLAIDYFDARGLRLGGWKTVHSGTGPLAPGKGTNDIEMTAFFVPQFATEARLALEAAVFADGSRWP